ncbi:BREX-2 system adenine-specific DNA-methyltransferase PglX [Streptomyces coelicoflavus]|uniref:BREX-2 system adenine-specific DNA-methyltransferase PglX n=1 Tax=Streptomyces coelicoflavus TaxID=285562 RepID=UPI0030B907C1
MTACQLATAFAFVPTPNHFVLDRSGKVFNRSAPVIKLPEGVSEERHLELLGLLNCSVACCWLKQVSRAKAAAGSDAGCKMRSGRSAMSSLAPSFKTSRFPNLSPLPSARAAVPTREALDEARGAQEQIRARMIALQEELDWATYGAYGLLTPAEVTRTTTSDLPEVSLGQRAFEIVLATSNAETAWFERHGSTPVAKIPAHWPEEYRKVAQARIDLIEANKTIRLIERPEYKRRWSIEPWEKRESAALRSGLLDAAEREELWFEEQDGYTVPRPLTVNQLADALRHDEDVQSVAALYAADHLGKRDASLAAELAAAIEAEHVPYAAALRYKDSGLRKRAQWEQVWEQQREEDRTGKRLDSKVPPKYTSADFLKNSYWSNRGKLDVPRERFISYPGASPESDTSLLLG